MLNDRLKTKLKNRKEVNALRSIINSEGIDFCSNDYLGFSKIKWSSQLSSGSTGSRLISGNNPQFTSLEKNIALLHKSESALLFNSGYTANLGFFSCIPQKNDTVIYDQLCHASIRDGINLGLARNFSFQHNKLSHLEQKLQQSSGSIFVAIESVYSMNGDLAPLDDISKICQKYNAHLIIDEAHALGVFGENGLGLANNIKSFARIYTYGKAMGSHGAAIVGSKLLIDYLINFSRPFIYTTALPPHSVERIKWAYENVRNNKTRELLHNHISFFKSKCKHPHLIESDSAIQCIIIGGNLKTKQYAQYLQSKGYDIRPILYPTVALDTERIRICLHTYNTKNEIENLCQLINQSI